jgi:hypothetical protein
MRYFVCMLLLGLPVSTFSAVGIDASAEQDTVMKVKYTGSSPTTSDPVMFVGGKKVGIKSVANTGASRGIVGAVGTATEPGGFSGNSIGVLGAAGDIGVLGSSFAYNGGVEGRGYLYGVRGIATGIGLSGTGESMGVEAYATEEWGVGVYGEATEANSLAGYFEGDVWASGDIDWGSDLALKQNIRPLERGLNSVMALRPKAYELKPGVLSARVSPGTKYGLVAQEVQLALPEIVKNRKAPPKKKQDGSLQTASERAEFKSVSYVALIPILIKAMQEQQEQIEMLKQEVQQLRGR